LAASSVLVAEVTTMQNDIRIAVQAAFTNIQIEGDNKILIQAIQGHIQPPWEIQTLMQDVLTFLHLCNNTSIRHIFRQENHAAD